MWQTLGLLGAGLGGLVSYLHNKARGGVVYGQYNTPKGYSDAQRKAECLAIALSHGILAIFHKPLRCLIAIINWLPT